MFLKKLSDALRPRPSTLAFLRAARRRPQFRVAEFIHGYVYARWPYFYIGLGIGERRLAQPWEALLMALWRWATRASARCGPIREGSAVGALPSPPRIPSASLADGYHAKVLLPSAAHRLVSVEREVSLIGLETVLPFPRARDLILQHPDHLVLLECPCRSVRPKPCLPLDVCLIIGEPFAGFMAEHHPGRSRWITREEALGVLQAATERGTVHHAFFKDAMLGRFYAICNCCECCCGALQAHRSGIPMIASSGFVARVDRQRCTGCGTCEAHCSFGAARVESDGARIDPVRCLGCGICQARCPAEAIDLRRDPARGDPLDLDALLAAAPATSPDPGGQKGASR